MSPPRRRRSQTMARSPRRSLASLLFALGCLAVLAVTFALGMAAGRRWPDGLPLPGLHGSTATAAARTERDTRRTEARGLDKDKGKARGEAPPVLTFYHELTAPLGPTAPPARTATKPERVEARSAETAKPAPRPEAVKAAAPASAPPVDTSLQDVEGTPAVAPPVAAKGDARFTVQVGAFKSRAQAEALRARLTAQGQDASLTEAEVAGTTQYRVRVGAFTTREAAQEAAGRLGNEHRLSTYVTTR